jgi:predicted MFS family arabinose efflux permease
MLGPVLAFLILAMMPGGYDILFVASFAVAIVGVGAIVLFVPARVHGERHVEGKPVSLRAAFELLRDRRFAGLVFAAFALGLATISDSFVYLVLQRKTNVGATAFPLLFVGTSLFTSIFAIPCGRLADRIGRASVLLAGYFVLAMVYVTLLVPGGTALLVAGIMLLGIFYAATDGVLTAMAAAVLPADRAGSGLAVLATATNVARLAASIAFGYLWTRTSAAGATAGYLVALTAVIVCVSIVLSRSQQDASTPSSSSGTV